jgi:hypothetical protein
MKSLKVPFSSKLGLLSNDQIVEKLLDKAVPQSINQLNWPDLFSFETETSFHIARDEHSLFIYYTAHDTYLKAVCSEDLQPVWKDSCVEFFVQIPGENHYFNFEFNCIGVCLAAKRESRSQFSYLTENELNQIKRTSNLTAAPFEEKEGDFNWNLLVSIPFSLIGLDGANLHEKIRANFYKCGDETSVPHYLSWSPIETPTPDYHRPEFFGEIYF